MRRILALMLLLPLLAACAGAPARSGANLAYSHHFDGLTCAPFARALTGVALSGDAADWWRLAAGRYTRLSHPAVGTVLVFRRSGRLPSGHVSVVSRLLDTRRIDVISANWVPGELDEDQLVVDVSARNDWSAVRVWYPPAGQLGTHPYATDGFIQPPQPLSHDALTARAMPAARAVTGG